MSYSILTNIASLQAQNYLRTTSTFQQKTIDRVTSGLRIVSAGDDAAGLAIANGLRSDQAVLNQGVRNANDGLSSLQTMDGGISNISNLLDRARTLATQSASGTFTGDRSVLDSEFQSVLSEINRQAQSIGLDTGGQFAQNLSVFIGGGRANNGVSAIDNGSVSVNLASSTVDTKSLGLMGAQAVGNAVDIGSASKTSVSKILADTRNTTATGGYTDFYFAGSGFSDANKVKVSVNIQSISDTASLATAVNAAIQSAGAVGTQQGTAFKNADIVASVKQNADGTQQLAFTSSSAAFQVQAGDKMANALMGNVKVVAAVPTTEGQDMNTTTVTGSAATQAGSTAITNPTGITFRFLGAGMAQAVDITLGQNSTTVGTAIADLSSQVANNATLKAAGITLTTATAGSQLQFSSARGETFDVQVAGDTTNELGFGSFQKNALNQFDYNALQATGTYDPSAAVPADAGTATLEFSINGAASSANNVAINLGAGDAQAASLSTSVLGATTQITAANNTLHVDVDGTIHNVTLSQSTMTAAATLATGGVDLVASPVTIAAATSGKRASADLSTGVSSAGTAASSATLTAGTVDLTTGIAITAATSGTESTGDLTAGVNVTTSNDILQIKVDGGNTQTFTLTTNAAAHASDIVADLTGKLVGATASVSGGRVVITSNATGTSSGIQVLAPANSADVLLGFADNNNHTGSNGNNQMTIATDGGGSTTITLSTATYSSDAAGATALAADINTKYGSNIATVDGSNHLVLASTTTGLGSSITLTNPAGNSAYTALGITGDAGTTAHGAAAGAGNNVLTIQVDGGGVQTFTLNQAANQHASDIQSQLSNLVGATATVLNNTVVITLTSTGTTSGITIGGSARSVLGFSAAANNGLAGNNQMTISTDGGTSKTITLTSGTNIAAATLVNDINTQYGANIASLDTTNSKYLVLASTTTGANSSITLAAPPIAANSAIGTLGLTAATAYGTVQADVSRDTIASNIATALGGGVTVQVGTNGAINIQSVNKGAGETIQVLAGSANATLGWAAAGGAVQYGVNRSAADLTNALNQAFSTNANLQNAGLKATYDGTAKQFTITSNNGTMFRVDARGGTTAATMQGDQSVATGGNFNLTGNNTLSINGQAVTLTSGNMTASAIQAAIAGTTGTGVTAAVVTSGGRDYLQLTSTATGSAASIAVTGSAATVLGLASSAQGTDASFGYGVGGATFAGNSATAASAAMFDAGGESATGALDFTALANGSDQQAITIAANDASGAQQSTTITLQNIAANRSGRSIDEAINAINSQLQQSDNSTLQKIVAVKVNDNGAEDIKFVSSLNSFTVSIGNTANNDGFANQGTTVTSALAAGGATADVASQQSAEAAVSAIATAVSTLGSAQAVVGKGENQFTYAINLAQSQITNEAAAESQIRDADLASEAANLTKAQILQQAGLAALAQANSAPQAVLALLRT